MVKTFTRKMKNYVTLAFCIMLCVVYKADAGCARNICPGGWTLRFGRCFFLNTNLMSYSEADAFCKSVGSQLGIVQNIDEMLYLYSVCSHCTFRVGAISIGHLTFQWPDGTILYRNSSFWTPGEPNNWSNSEYCVSVKTTSHGGYGLNDDSCGTKEIFICERPLS